MVRTRIALLAVGMVALSLTVVGGRAEGTSWSIEGSINKGSLVLGQTFRIDVHTEPTEPGRTVHLQERKSGSWQVIKVGHLDSSSNESFTHAPQTRGTHNYRVVVPATQSAPQLVAGPWKVVVQKWVFLDTLSASPPPAPEEKGVKIKGDFLARSITYKQCGASKTWTYQLNGKYETFRTYIGVRDSGDPEANKQITVTSSDQVVSEFMSVGERKFFSMDVLGHNTLTVKVFGDCGSPDTFGTLGNPQLLTA